MLKATWLCRASGRSKDGHKVTGETLGMEATSAVDSMLYPPMARSTSETWQLMMRRRCCLMGNLEIHLLAMIWDICCRCCSSCCCCSWCCWTKCCCWSYCGCWACSQICRSTISIPWNSVLVCNSTRVWGLDVAEFAASYEGPEKSTTGWCREIRTSLFIFHCFPFYVITEVGDVFLYDATWSQCLVEQTLHVF